MTGEGTPGVPLHLVKLCVGIDSVDQLRDWQKRRGVKSAAGVPVVVHYTRNRPRRRAELLDGGSLYWVIRGAIRVRNRLIAVERVERRDGSRGCALVLEARPVETRPKRHRPIRGWRYLAADRAPPDLDRAAGGQADGLPASLAAELRELGLI